MQTDDEPVDRLAAADQPKRRGRKPKGDVIPIRLDTVERAIAERYGNGRVADGVRVALKVVDVLGLEAVEALASRWNNPKPKP